MLDLSATTPGYMDRVACDTRAPLGGSLQSALGWSSTTGGTSGTLGGQARTVAGGALTGAVSITYTQALTASDEPTQGDCYAVDVTIRVIEG